MFAINVGISTCEALVTQVYIMLRTHEAGFFFRMTRAFSHSYVFPFLRYFSVNTSSEFLSAFICRPLERNGRFRKTGAFFCRGGRFRLKGRGTMK
jgi:hypothetical protein